MKKVIAVAAVGSVVGLSCFSFWAVLHRKSLPNGGRGVAFVSAGETTREAVANAKAAAPSAVTETISDDALRLSSSDGSRVTAAERREALQRLTCGLGDGEIAAVTNFLNSSGRDTPGMTPGQRLALKNDALDLLQRQERPVPGLGTLLVKMMDDPRQPEAWRDYCVQGLAGQYIRASALEAEGCADAERKLVVDAYAAVFSRPDLSAFRGTALRGIANAERECPGVANDADLDGKIRSVISGGSSDEASLITALRMCCGRDLADCIGQVSNIAERGKSPLLRKVAAKTLEDFASTSTPRTP